MFHEEGVSLERWSWNVGQGTQDVSPWESCVQTNKWRSGGVGRGRESEPRPQPQPFAPAASLYPLWVGLTGSDQQDVIKHSGETKMEGILTLELSFFHLFIHLSLEPLCHSLTRSFLHSSFIHLFTHQTNISRILSVALTLWDIRDSG